LYATPTVMMVSDFTKFKLRNKHEQNSPKSAEFSLASSLCLEILFRKARDIILPRTVRLPTICSKLRLTKFEKVGSLALLRGSLHFLLKPNQPGFKRFGLHYISSSTGLSSIFFLTLSTERDRSRVLLGSKYVVPSCNKVAFRLAVVRFRQNDLFRPIELALKKDTYNVYVKFNTKTARI
jgi:hypothetical protein